MTTPGPAGPTSTPYPPGVAPTPPPGEAGVVPPPAGPGVLAPFPVPPTEGRGARVWLGLGVGTLVFTLCCGAGGAAVVGLGLTATRALNEQAHAVVGGYLDAVREQDYPSAYDLLCDQAQEGESVAQFTGRVRAEPPITAYQLGNLPFTQPELWLPVELTFGTGTTGRWQVRLEQDTGTGEFEVCEIER